jgi:uncharacterized protein (DUF2225 family)
MSHVVSCLEVNPYYYNFVYIPICKYTVAAAFEKVSEICRAVRVDGTS